MGFRGSRRLRVFVEGPALRGQSPELKGAGDSIKRFLEFRHYRTGTKARPPALAIRTVQEIRRSRFFWLPELLPKALDGCALRHVVEVRNDSFKAPAFVALLRKFGIALCYAEHDTYTEIADVTADFVYARLQKGDEKLKAGYPPKAFDPWAARAKIWAGGGEPKDLPKIAKTSATKQPRDVFIYFIHEAKIRAPAAAMALIERLGEDQRR